MPVQPATVGKKKSWLKWAGSSATQVIGLAVIFVAVFYLLAGFMAALDAIAFQERVLRVVGDNNIDRARIVLTKLDELDSQASPLQPADRDLPISTLALQLDRVKLLTADLARFNNALLPPRAKPEEGGGTAAAADSDEAAGNREQVERQNLVAQLRGLGIDLERDFDTLDATLEEAIPGIAVMRSLEKIKQTTDELETIGTEGFPTSEVTEADPAPFVAFGLALGEMELELQALAGLAADAPRPQAEAELIKNSLDQALAQTQELRRLADGPIAQVAASTDAVRTLMSNLAAEVGVLSAQLETAKPALLQSKFADLDNGIDDLIAALSAVATPPDGLAQVDPPSPPPPPAADVARQIEELAVRASTLSNTVHTALPNVEAAQKLTQSLAQMGLAVESLSAMEVNEAEIHTRIGDREFVGLPPDELYREKLELLNNATGAMTTALAEVTDQGKIAELLLDDPLANYKAGVILSDFSSFGRYGFLLTTLKPFGFNPKSLAVSSREGLDILLILIIGAIGSMIYMTQRTLRLAIDGQSDNPDKAMPVSWYVFRPVFGAVVAFALYLVYKTGQVALGSGGLSSALQSGVNIPILAVLGLFAGLLSWQVLEMIQSKGQGWIAGAERRDLWATGLLRALEAKEQTPESCARHVGYTIGQIDRWIALKDKATPEMQDRVSTWLGISRDEIFSSLAPNEVSRDRSMYAVGLKPYLQRTDAKYDVQSIAKALVVDPAVVERWRDQKLAVSSNLQWTLTELLGVRYAEFYDARPDHRKYWAVGWRSLELPAELGTADQLAARLGISASLVRDWRELEQPVPAKTADTLAELFAVVPEKLFDPEFEHAANRFRAKEQALGAAILAAFGPSGNVSPIGGTRAAGSAGAAPSQHNEIAAFAVAMDVSDAKAQAWLKGEKLYRPTCEAISRLLGKPLDALFDELT